MATIAAIIITKDEEKNIARCLQAIDGWVDEIIVVDSFSTDKTKEICESFSAVNFVQNKWPGFSAQKNFADNLASSDYILSIDADEVITDGLKKEILRRKDSLSGAFFINRLTNYCGHWIYHSGWHPDYQLRLYPRKIGEWDGAAVHEKVIFNTPIKTEKLPGIMEHYSYESISDHILRMDSYSTLGAQKILEKGEKFLALKAIIRPLFRFFRTYFLKLGFLDGFYGLCISVFAAINVFLKYMKAYHLKTDLH